MRNLPSWRWTRSSIELVGRQVALVGDLAADVAIDFVVEVVVISFEDGVTPDAERLVDLKVKTD